MELLIFGLVNLVVLGGFLATSVLPFYLASRLGYKIDARVGRIGLRLLLPLLLFASLAAWVAASYSVFKRECQLLPAEAILIAPGTRPMGFAVYGDRNSFTGTSFSWSAAIERGHFQFVDSDVGRRCAGKNSTAGTPTVPVEIQCSQYASDRSKFAVHILPAKRVEYWWSPPIFVAELQVKEKSSGNLVATATDLIFGGGLVGLYMRALGGDQDFSRLSCGFASRNVGPWRPSLASRPRFSQYEEADLAFVNRALAGH